MTVNKAYKFRLYPSEEQKVLIHKTFGCNRLLYNKMLSLKKEDSEVDSCSLMCSVFDRYYKNLGGLLKYKKY